jgi:Protein of unknown function (DUF3572)
MTSDDAETIALKALAYLTNRADALERFLALSGAGPADLRARAGEPDFLAGVADFLLADEALLTGFCEAEALDAKSVHMARHVLAGA